MGVETSGTEFHSVQLAHYVAPGGTVLIAFVAVIASVESLHVSLADFGIAFLFLFLFASYLIGQVLNLAGTQVERWRKKKWGGFPSATLLTEEDGLLAPDFKRNLVQCIERDFGLPLGKISEDDSNANAAFNLSYSWLQAKGLAAACRRYELEYLLMRNLN